MIQMFTTSRIQETKMRLQMFTTSRIQETKMQYDTNVYHLQNIGDKDAIRYRCLPPLEYRRQRCDYKCLPPLEYRRQRCNMIQMFTTSRIQETKMQYDTNAYHLQNIGDKDAIRYRCFPPLGYRRQRCDYKYLPPLEYRRPRSNMISPLFLGHPVLMSCILYCKLKQIRFVASPLYAMTVLNM